MESYIKNVKKNLSTIDQKKLIHIVIGNESSDLDSCISSIAYAYLLNITECKSNDDCIVIPVINTKRSLLKLKTEVLYWLNNVLNVTGDVLVCKDDLDFQSLKDEDRRVLITLTDHNFNEEFELVGNLTEIIDHHQESSNRSTNARTEIDSTVGSCCTLVARRFINYYEKNNLKIDEQIARLLYGPIILDTINFHEDARRFNEIDVQIVEKLESAIKQQDSSIARDDIFSQLIDARNSVAGLTFKETLYKDMKRLDLFDGFEVIVPSISGELVGDLVSGEKLNQSLNDLKELCSEKNYSLIVLMAIKQSPNLIKRDLAIFTLNEHLLRRVTEALMNYNNREIELDIVESRNNFILFSQKNVRASRKVVLPVLEQLFSSESFIEEYKSGLFTTINKPLDKLQINDPKSISDQVIKPGTSPIQQRSNEGKLNGQESRGSSIDSTNLMDGSKAPDSINYYESYIMDSYVGDFNGEVANDKLLDQNINELNWEDEQKIENALEFGFDSFGPESILFQTNGDSLTNQARKMETIKESSEKIDLNKDESTCKDKKFVSNESNYIISNNNNEDYGDLVSLSIAEPQLKRKLDNCFDKNRIRDGYSSTVEPKSILALDRQFSNASRSFDENEDQSTNDQSASSKEEFLDERSHLDNENFNSLIENSKSFDSNLKIECSSLKIDYEEGSTLNEKDCVANLIETSNLVNDSKDDKNDDSKDNETNASDSSKTVTNLSAEDDEKTLTDDSSFKRQTTLTKSQRRRISPKIRKFEEVPSTLDDTNLILNNDPFLNQLQDNKQENDKFKELKDLPLNENLPANLIYPPADALNVQEGHARTGTLKKKIVADYQDSHEDATATHSTVNNHENDHLNNYYLENNLNNEHLHNDQNQQPSDQLTSSINQAGKMMQDELRRLELEQEEDGTDLNQEQFNCPKFIGREGEIRKIDMKVIEPYTRVLSHAGYYTNNSNQALGESNAPAVILFSSCYLPDRKRKDYDYVMDHLFWYVLTTLHQLIANEYIMIYFNGGTSSNNNMPTFNFLRRCYYMIDRKLRKSLKALYLVHPTLWLKGIVVMTRPFINTKFSKKLKFVNNLSELDQLVRIDRRIIPEPVKQYDEAIERKKRRR